MRDGVILSFVAVVTLILYLTLTRDSFLANDTSAHSSSTKVVANPSENAIGKTYRGGLVKSSPGRAWPGFTLYPTVGDAHVRILNMLGEPVHSWNVDAMRAQLLLWSHHMGERPRHGFWC